MIVYYCTFAQLINAQKEGEKKLDDHEMSRFNLSTSSINGKGGVNSSGAADDTAENEDPETEETAEANRALKQKTLMNELTNLNKVLAEKEQLASTMKVNDGKLQEIR